MPTYVAADQAELHYDVSGAGQPIVTLAGGAARHPSYLGDLAGLPGRLITPHLRGVGESPAPPTPEAGSFWRQAADIDALREHLGLEQLTIVAHSAGTRLTIAYAVQFPGRVAAMLLITPPTSGVVAVPSDVEKLVAHHRGEPAYDAALAARDPRLASTQAEFEERAERLAPLGYARWTEVEQAHSRIGEWRLAATQAFFSVAPPADMAEQVAKIDARVRVIAGAEDYLIGLEPVLALAKLFPNGDVVVLDDCGHFPFVEQPAAFRRAADEFLAYADFSRRSRREG